MRRLQATQTAIKDENHTTIEVAETSHTEIAAHATTSREVDEQVVTTVVEYDTSQPTNPETGTPPIARTVTQVRRTADKLNRDEHQTQAEETAREVAAETLQTESVAQAMQVSEKRGLPPIVKILCGIGIIAVIGVLLWVFRKLNIRF